MLDEPTNDLDVDPLRALEETLLEFPGTALVISHDRWFLDQVATHNRAYEGEGKVVFCEGNFQEHEAAGEDPDSPTGSSTSGWLEDRAQRLQG